MDQEKGKKRKHFETDEDPDPTDTDDEAEKPPKRPKTEKSEKKQDSSKDAAPEKAKTKKPEKGSSSSSSNKKDSKESKSSSSSNGDDSKMTDDPKTSDDPAFTLLAYLLVKEWHFWTSRMMRFKGGIETMEELDSLGKWMYVLVNFEGFERAYTHYAAAVQEHETYNSPEFKTADKKKLAPDMPLLDSAKEYLLRMNVHTKGVLISGAWRTFTQKTANRSDTELRELLQDLNNWRLVGGSSSALAVLLQGYERFFRRAMSNAWSYCLGNIKMPLIWVWAVQCNHPEAGALHLVAKHLSVDEERGVHLWDSWGLAPAKTLHELLLILTRDYTNNRPRDIRDIPAALRLVNPDKKAPDPPFVNYFKEKTLQSARNEVGNIAKKENADRRRQLMSVQRTVTLMLTNLEHEFSHLWPELQGEEASIHELRQALALPLRMARVTFNLGMSHQQLRFGFLDGANRVKRPEFTNAENALDKWFRGMLDKVPELVGETNSDRIRELFASMRRPDWPSEQRPVNGRGDTMKRDVKGISLRFSMNYTDLYAASELSEEWAVWCQTLRIVGGANPAFQFQGRLFYVFTERVTVVPYHLLKSNSNRAGLQPLKYPEQLYDSCRGGAALVWSKYQDRKNTKKKLDLLSVYLPPLTGNGAGAHITPVSLKVLLHLQYLALRMTDTQQPLHLLSVYEADPSKAQLGMWKLYQNADIQMDFRVREFFAEQSDMFSRMAQDGQAAPWHKGVLAHTFPDMKIDTVPDSDAVRAIAAAIATGKLDRSAAEAMSPAMLVTFFGAALVEEERIKRQRAAAEQVREKFRKNWEMRSAVEEKKGVPPLALLFVDALARMDREEKKKADEAATEEESEQGLQRQLEQKKEKRQKIVEDANRLELEYKRLAPAVKSRRAEVQSLTKKASAAFDKKYESAKSEAEVKARDAAYAAMIAEKGNLYRNLATEQAQADTTENELVEAKGRLAAYDRKIEELQDAIESQRRAEILAASKEYAERDARRQDWITRSKHRLLQDAVMNEDARDVQAERVAGASEDQVNQDKHRYLTFSEKAAAGQLKTKVAQFSSGIVALLKSAIPDAESLFGEKHNTMWREYKAWTYGSALHELSLLEKGATVQAMEFTKDDILRFEEFHTGLTDLKVMCWLNFGLLSEDQSADNYQSGTGGGGSGKEAKATDMADGEEVKGQIAPETDVVYPVSVFESIGGLGDPTSSVMYYLREKMHNNGIDETDFADWSQLEETPTFESDDEEEEKEETVKVDDDEIIVNKRKAKAAKKKQAEEAKERKRAEAKRVYDAEVKTLTTPARILRFRLAERVNQRKRKLGNLIRKRANLITGEDVEGVDFKKLPTVGQWRESVCVMACQACKLPDAESEQAIPLLLKAITDNAEDDEEEQLLRCTLLWVYALHVQTAIGRNEKNTEVGYGEAGVRCKEAVLKHVANADRVLRLRGGFLFALINTDQALQSLFTSHITRILFVADAVICPELAESVWAIPPRIENGNSDELDMQRVFLKACKYGIYSSKLAEEKKKPVDETKMTDDELKGKGEKKAKELPGIAESFIQIFCRAQLHLSRWNGRRVNERRVVTWAEEDQQIADSRDDDAIDRLPARTRRRIDDSDDEDTPALSGKETKTDIKAQQKQAMEQLAAKRTEAQDAKSQVLPTLRTSARSEIGLYGSYEPIANLDRPTFLDWIVLAGDASAAMGQATIRSSVVPDWSLNDAHFLEIGAETTPFWTRPLTTLRDLDDVIWREINLMAGSRSALQLRDVYAAHHDFLKNRPLLNWYMYAIKEHTEELRAYISRLISRRNKFVAAIRAAISKLGEQKDKSKMRATALMDDEFEDVKKNHLAARHCVMWEIVAIATRPEPVDVEDPDAYKRTQDKVEEAAKELMNLARNRVTLLERKYTKRRVRFAFAPEGVQRVAPESCGYFVTNLPDNDLIARRLYLTDAFDKKQQQLLFQKKTVDQFNVEIAMRAKFPTEILEERVMFAYRMRAEQLREDNAWLATVALSRTPGAAKSHLPGTWITNYGKIPVLNTEVHKELTMSPIAITELTPEMREQVERISSYLAGVNVEYESDEEEEESEAESEEGFEGDKPEVEEEGKEDEEPVAEVGEGKGEKRSGKEEKQDSKRSTARMDTSSDAKKKKKKKASTQEEDDAQLAREIEVQEINATDLDNLSSSSMGLGGTKPMDTKGRYRAEQDDLSEEFAHKLIFRDDDESD